MRFVMISLCDRGNLGARQLVARGKALGHEMFLINFGEYEHETYQFSEEAEGPERCASFCELEELLPKLKPDVIGISYRSRMAKMAFEVSCSARTATGHRVPIIAGGIGATSAAIVGPWRAWDWANYICLGEGDDVIKWLLEPSDEKFCPVPLIERKREHMPHRGSSVVGPLLQNLDDAPFPDYTAETTWTIVRGKVIHPDGRLDNDRGAYPLLTSRGCPRACTYCHNSTVHELYRGQKYCRQRSVEDVMTEIFNARERWDLKLLSIYDDLFIANPEWVFEFARELPNVWPNARFWCMTHPIYIRADVIRALVDVGLEEVCLGVQSGSDRILKLYRRGTTREQILEACDILATFPLTVKIDVISANPMEAQEDILDTMRLLQKMPMRRAEAKGTWHPGLSRLTIFPGSKIADQVTQAQCDALHNERQDFVDGLYRAAFIPRWNSLDLVNALSRWEDFLRFRDSRDWPADQGPLSDEHWMPLTTWLDEGAPR